MRLSKCIYWLLFATSIIHRQQEKPVTELVLQMFVSSSSSPFPSLSPSFLSLYVPAMFFSFNNSPRCLSQSPLEVLSLKATFISPLSFFPSLQSLSCVTERKLLHVYLIHTL